MNTPATPPDDFKNLIDLFAVFSEATAQLTALQAEIDHQQLDTVDEHKARYAALQKSLTESEAAIRFLATAHPEWFSAEKKSVATPFGSLAQRATTRHEAPDEERSIALIEKAAAAHELRERTAEAALLRGFIRVEKTLDLDALGKADADLLAKLLIVRVEDVSYTVKPASVKLGQAVKAAEKRAEKKAGVSA